MGTDRLFINYNLYRNLVTDDIPRLEPATRGATAVDLRSTRPLVIGPGQRRLVDTGLRVEIPEGYAGLVLPRSGYALSAGLTVLNAPGLIDSDYRGEIGVILYNAGQAQIRIDTAQRIAQLLIVQVPPVAFRYTEELGATERGEDGFGSTGVS